MGIKEAILSIVILFPILLLGKRATKFRFCVICTSVSLTWIGLLVIRFAEWTVDPVVLALLMGESVVGVYYLLEKKVPERFYLFRLPALITLTLAAYTVIAVDIYYPALYIALLVWIVFGLIYVFRERPGIKKAARRIIECCKDW